jgi:hypothetical protein
VISLDHPSGIPNLEHHSSWTSFNTIFIEKRSLPAKPVKFVEKLSVVFAHVYQTSGKSRPTSQEAPETPVQQRSLPVPYSNIRRFDGADMSEAGPSAPHMRTIRLPSEQRNVMFNPAPLDWSATDTNLYNRPGIQMILGGPVTQLIWDYVELLFSSPYVTRSATAKQGLANFLFRGAYTRGMDLTTFKLIRLQGAKVYPKFEDISAQDGTR